MFILHPYTVIGKPGTFVTGIFALYGLWYGVKKEFAQTFLSPALILILIGCFGAVISIFNDILQLNHLRALVSFAVTLMCTYGIVAFAIKTGVTKKQLVTVILFSYVFNSIIIIFELSYPSFRSFVEGYLDPISYASINYSEGFRLRGIATTGGAGLSMGAPLSLILAMYLYNEKVLSTLGFYGIVGVLLFSVMVIGRTGLLLCVIPIFSYIALLLGRGNVFRLTSISIILVFLSPIIYALVTGYFSDMFDEGFVNYSVGFMMKGSEGFQEEGTANLVIQYLSVLPTEFPQIITGYGFYGGSYFYPWTDSGFARTFLSVGFLAGGLFYLILYRIYFSGFKSNKFLIGNLILLLTIAEVKEPMLFSGLSSRMFILVLVGCWFEDYYLKINKVQKDKLNIV